MKKRNNNIIQKTLSEIKKEYVENKFNKEKLYNKKTDEQLEKDILSDPDSDILDVKNISCDKIVRHQ